MLIDKLMTVFSDDIGIDLGTMNTLVHVAGRGIVMEEPSVVALNKDTNKVIAVGKRAKDMLGRNPGNILTIRPMKDGVIADAEVADEMLRYFINKSCGHYKVMQPRVVIAVPYGINEVEVRAVQDSAKKAGAREVRLVPEPLASAIGVKLPVSDPTGSMIVDIGGGTSEVAIISLSSIVNAESVKCGGDAMDDAIREYMMKTHSLLIGERMAEDIKKTIGSAAPVENLQDSMEVKGRELGQHGNSLPREVTITAEEIRPSSSIRRPSMKSARRWMFLSIRLLRPSVARWTNASPNWQATFSITESAWQAVGRCLKGWRNALKLKRICLPLWQKIRCMQSSMVLASC